MYRILVIVALALAVGTALHYTPLPEFLKPRPVYAVMYLVGYSDTREQSALVVGPLDSGECKALVGDWRHVGGPRDQFMVTSCSPNERVKLNLSVMNCHAQKFTNIRPGVVSTYYQCEGVRP